MAKLEIPQFDSVEEEIKFLVENKSIIETQKKSAIKLADSVGFGVVSMRGLDEINKADSNSDGAVKDEIKVKAVINTTNILDSHGDVHVKGIWNKSVKENKRMLHVQEHQSNKFDKIISSGDDLEVSVKEYTWKELGYDAEGKTEALVFDSLVKQSRNKEMFEGYSKGYITNHSVGMRYVKMAFAVNSEDYPEEKKFGTSTLMKLQIKKMQLQKVDFGLY